MEALAWVVLAMVLFLTALHIIFSKLSNSHNRQPPGPKPWPIVGNLNLIGPLPHQSLHKLSQKYGHLMQLRYGSFPVVIASSAEMAKQFLKTHDHIFAARPATAAGKYIDYNYSNITWAPPEPYWRQGRKIFITELFTSKKLDKSEYIRVEERQAFISRLFALSGNPVLIKDHLSCLTLSVISRIALGKIYFSLSKHGNEIVTLEEFREMFDELFLLHGVLNIGDWIPWINFLDLQGYVRRMKDLCKKFDRFHDHVIDDHRARKIGEKDYVDRDIVDLLLELVDDPNDLLEVKLNNDGVKGLIQDLLAGGIDTSTTTIEWAVSEVLKHPHIMNKATEELDRVIGKNRWVEETDLTQLPYIDAIMKETMRLHPVAVMLAPHLALENCNISGYDIHKGTTVFINTWSIGRDPAIWDEPEEFKPERFLGKGFDVKGQSFELLPFGSGRRMCPAYSLGLKMVRSSLANIFHGFHLKLPSNMKIEDLNMEEVYGLTTHRKFPLVTVMEPRLPIHLYRLPK